ncbi:hypothetical protein GUJ93_ZPchr0012g18898 [Zizania palustris]|uniref:Uncharacterized protein n=1 Tax=Zizania palustris TaxID=103762 RepID=A0A8J6BZ74_ZIZPA|nr:hypothetical protein GUJ93_ZPchr0012g18898 [Zizania palustris]
MEEVGVNTGGHMVNKNAEFSENKSTGGVSVVGGSSGVSAGVADGKSGSGVGGYVEADIFAGGGFVHDQDGLGRDGGISAEGFAAQGSVHESEGLVDTLTGLDATLSVAGDEFHVVGVKKNSKRKVVKGPPVVVRQSSRLKLGEAGSARRREEASRY